MGFLRQFHCSHQRSTTNSLFLLLEKPALAIWNQVRFCLAFFLCQFFKIFLGKSSGFTCDTSGGKSQKIPALKRYIGKNSQTIPALQAIHPEKQPNDSGCTRDTSGKITKRFRLYKRYNRKSSQRRKREGTHCHNTAKLQQPKAKYGSSHTPTHGTRQSRQ